MLLAFALIVGTAQAFETIPAGGSELHWDQMPIRWTYDSAGAPAHIPHDEQVAAVRAAIGVWQAVDGARLRFEEGPPVGAQEMGVIYWDNVWDDPEGTAALTSTVSTSTGRILGFKVRLNGRTIGWSTNGAAMDLQSVLAHEIGHAIGLDHNDHDDQATMFPVLNKRDLSKRDLNEDDASGARYLYGESGPPITVTDAGQLQGSWSAAARTGCATGGGAATLPGLLVPLLLVARRTRRQR